MTKKYYAVTAKFGHVGQNKFIIKTIPVVACSGKEAASKARATGRVKHHAKDAILSVKEIDKEQYLSLERDIKEDPFFHCGCIQEQRQKCIGIEEDILYSDDDIDDDWRKENRRNKVKFHKKKNKVIRNDQIYQMRYYESVYVY